MANVKPTFRSEDITDDFIVKGMENGVTPTRIDSVDDNGKKRLCVDSQTSPGGQGALPVISPLVYDDMNVANGGVARGTGIAGTAFVTLYEYLGSGSLFGFVLTLESMDNEWFIRLIVDGSEVFLGVGGISTRDLEKNDKYGFDKSKNDSNVFAIGFHLYDNTIRWQGPLNYPLRFNSSVKIQAKYKNGSSTKKFRAGLVSLSR